MHSFSLRPSALSVRALVYDLSDDELRSAAERAAASVRRLAETSWSQFNASDELVMRTLHRMARCHGVTPPSKQGLRPWLNRMADPSWWRRAMRSRFRDVELHEIRRGAVHRQAGEYVSSKALRRFERSRKHLASLLASLDLVNQTTGEVMPLQDIVDASLANPTNRRKAMMARIKGIEEQAKAQDHEALFITITCPSRMHPRHVSGAPNERYDGTSPRQAQAYLGRLWNKAMRHAAHQGLCPYGMRVVEPHHDATPHWHVLVFAPAEQLQAITSIFRAYALADSPDEPGAQERRFTVERIDPRKGSAVGYVAKYVSKSIDGEGVASDDESGLSGADASRRIVAWARTWAIRQFQFFGVPSITPAREFYRLDGEHLPSQALREAHQACKANDYAAWLSTCQAHGLSFKVQYAERPSGRYAEEVTRSIQGLQVQGADLAGVLDLVTRLESWRVMPRKQVHGSEGEGASTYAAAALPWTRFNNSASVDSQGFFDQPGPVKEHGALQVPRRPCGDARSEALAAQAKRLDRAGFRASAMALMRKAWARADRLAMAGGAA